MDLWHFLEVRCVFHSFALAKKKTQICTSTKEVKTNKTGNGFKNEKLLPENTFEMLKMWISFYSHFTDTTPYHIAPLDTQTRTKSAPIKFSFIINFRVTNSSTFIFFFFFFFISYFIVRISVLFSTRFFKIILIRNLVPFSVPNSTVTCQKKEKRIKKVARFVNYFD